MSDIDLISPNQVIARLDIPSSTLYRWISEGRFPKPVKIGPRRTAFRMSDIENWLEKRVSVTNKYDTNKRSHHSIEEVQNSFKERMIKNKKEKL